MPKPWIRNCLTCCRQPCLNSFVLRENAGSPPHHIVYKCLNHARVLRVESLGNPTNLYQRRPLLQRNAWEIVPPPPGRFFVDWDTYQPPSQLDTYKFFMNTFWMICHRYLAPEFSALAPASLGTKIKPMTVPEQWVGQSKFSTLRPALRIIASIWASASDCLQWTHVQLRLCCTTLLRWTLASPAKTMEQPGIFFLTSWKVFMIQDHVSSSPPGGA